MRRRLLRSLVVLLVVGVAALAARVGAVAGPGPPTAIGTGGAAATVETLATQAAIETLRAGGNAVDAAVTAAAVLGVTEPFSCGIGGGGFMVIYRASDRQRDDDRRPRERPGRDAPRLLLGERQRRSRSTTRATAASPSECREPSRRGTRRWSATARSRSRTALAPGIRVARDGFVVDQTFFDQTQANVDWFDDIPAIGGALPRSGRDAARRRHRLPQPGSRTHLRADRAPRGEGLLPRRGRGRARRDRPAPARLADRQPHLAAGTHDDARPAHATPRPSARRRASATAGSTSTGWARPRAAARPWARR